MAIPIQQDQVGEKITSIEQFGHRSESIFYVRTEQHPDGGWVHSANDVTFAAAAAVWAALKTGNPVTALLYYTSYDPSTPHFNGVTRIFLS